MATQLTNDQVTQLFPGAHEAVAAQFDEDEEWDQDHEYWTHLGVLYSRTWWTAQGWHYGIWTGRDWQVPERGEVECPWSE